MLKTVVKSTEDSICKFFELYYTNNILFNRSNIVITLEYHRYMFDETLNKITVLKESKLIDQVKFKEVYDHKEVSSLLSEAYKHAKEWINNHEGRIIGRATWDGIDYKFELHSLARLFETLIQDGHIPVIEKLK